MARFFERKNSFYFCFFWGGFKYGFSLDTFETPLVQHTYTHTQTHTHTCTHTRSLSHTHIHIYICVHTHTHANTHILIYIYIYIYERCRKVLGRIIERISLSYKTFMLSYSSTHFEYRFPGYFNFSKKLTNFKKLIGCNKKFCIYIYIYIYIHIHICVCVCVCIYVCVCVCVCVCSRSDRKYSTILSSLRTSCGALDITLQSSSLMTILHTWIDTFRFRSSVESETSLSELLYHFIVVFIVTIRLSILYFSNRKTGLETLFILNSCH